MEIENEVKKKLEDSGSGIGSWCREPREISEEAMQKKRDGIEKG